MPATSVVLLQQGPSRLFALRAGAALLLAGGLLFAATAAYAQQWPAKPVRMIVPFAVRTI